MENSCCCRKDDPRFWKKKVRLIFKRSELLQDAANIGFVEGDVKKTDDEHDRHQIQDIVQDGNVERVTRVLNLTMADVRELCYPYTKVEAEDGMEVDDTYTEPGTYILNMRIPDSFSETTVDYLKELIHELLTCRVLEDWFSVTKPESAQNWGSKAEKVRSQITSALNRRMGKVRLHLNPF